MFKNRHLILKKQHLLADFIFLVYLNTRTVYENKTIIMDGTITILKPILLFL
ncbi:hypothetical protein SAMN04488024_10436 [Pedobacter soli]|uniref:Uncharacterized protein n=1 Tax=Pedobacter soli TaxID=390242 RepID=A0A1G6RRN4_9SPHI|nr:hypothetical protein SAMN04488024_10436 [Pedobacter soli]